MTTSAASTSVTTRPLGTRHTAFRPVILEVLGPVAGDFDLFHSLSFQSEFEHFSPEELRLADYESGPVFANAPTSNPTRRERLPARASSRMPGADSAHSAQSDTSSADDSFSRTREDGLQLLLSDTSIPPHIRFPPLSGLDEYTIQRLYSPAVANMVRTHPKLVDWLGASVVAIIESLASKEGPLDEDVEMHVADLKIEVMRAKLGEAKAKQLRQQALEELKTIRKEACALPQKPSAIVHATSTGQPSSTPESMSVVLAEGHPAIISRDQSHFPRRTSTPIPPVANALTLRSNPASGSLPARPHTSVRGLFTPSAQRSRPLVPHAEAQYFRNSGTSNTSFACSRSTFSPQPSTKLFSSHLDKPGHASTPQSAQYVSSHTPLLPTTTSSTETFFNRNALSSGTPSGRPFAFGNPSNSNGPLFPGPTVHEDTGERAVLPNTGQSNTSLNSAPLSALRGPAPKHAGRKRRPDACTRKQTYRPAKRAKSDQFMKREDDRS